jgi:hypothetical protein
MLCGGPSSNPTKQPSFCHVYNSLMAQLTATHCSTTNSSPLPWFYQSISRYLLEPHHISHHVPQYGLVCIGPTPRRTWALRACLRLAGETRASKQRLQSELTTSFRPWLSLLTLALHRNTYSRPSLDSTMSPAVTLCISSGSFVSRTLAELRFRSSATPQPC